MRVNVHLCVYVRIDTCHLPLEVALLLAKLQHAETALVRENLLGHLQPPALHVVLVLLLLCGATL